MRISTRVLIYPGGSENALEIYAALSRQVNITLYGASSRVDHGSLCYRNYCSDFPNIFDADFLPSLQDYIRRFDIDVIIPTHDDVTLALARVIDSVPCKVAVAGLHQAELCRDKALCFEALKAYEFCPRVFANLSDAEFPCFMKPRRGQGGQGARVLYTPELLGSADDYILCEYLPGVELTVDCFSDRHGKLRFVGPRTRERIFGGISVRARTLNCTPEVRFIAQEIHTQFKMRGLWYFQVKQAKNGAFKLLEVSGRAAGGISLYRQRGVNIPLITVMDLMEMEVEIIDQNFDVTVDRCLQPKYKIELDFSQIYIDFDDTIVGSAGVFPEVIAFIYQMKSIGKELILISRNKGDLISTLKNNCIPTSLFRKIIQLDAFQPKSTFIEPQGSIFIDNSFAERKEVYQKHGIPCFDVNTVECIIALQRA